MLDITKVRSETTAIKNFMDSINTKNYRQVDHASDERYVDKMIQAYMDEGKGYALVNTYNLTDIDWIISTYRNNGYSVSREVSGYASGEAPLKIQWGAGPVIDQNDGGNSSPGDYGTITPGQAQGGNSGISQSDLEKDRTVVENAIANRGNAGYTSVTINTSQLKYPEQILNEYTIRGYFAAIKNGVLTIDWEEKDRSTVNRYISLAVSAGNNSVNIPYNEIVGLTPIMNTYTALGYTVFERDAGLTISWKTKAESDDYYSNITDFVTEGNGTVGPGDNFGKGEDGGSSTNP